MKSILDFYECGLNATPANTMGMGNPMPATENTSGSEPLVPANKCKKAKCKKEKIDEASLLDIEGSIKYGDNAVCIIDYVNFLAKSNTHEPYTENDINGVINYCLKYNVLTCNKSGEILCDYGNLEKGANNDKMMFFKSYSLVCSASGIDIDTKLLPKSIKKITFKNFNTELCLDIFGNNDLSGVDLEFMGGNLKITTMDNDAIVKFGKVNCNTLYVRDNRNKDIHTKGISLKTGSTIQTLDLSKCQQLGLLIGKKLNIGNIALNPNFAEHAVRNSGFANQNTKAWVVNERYR